MRDQDFEEAPVEVLPAKVDNALEQISRAEVDIQIATAKKFPRDVRRAKERIRQIALMDDETAAECYYVMPRDGKSIEGPSIRLAEIVATSWGNLRLATRVMDIGEKEVTTAAVCHDLETNVAVSSEVKRRITKKDGRRYGDDMILTTCNAAASIAFRNAVFKVVPKGIWHPVYKEAMDQATGKVSEIDGKRKQALAFFKARGVPEEKVLHKIGRERVADIDGEDIKTLRGMATAIKQETSTVEEMFENGNSGPAVKKSLNLNKPAPEVEEPREPGSDG